jgi:hypothetical protein
MLRTISHANCRRCIPVADRSLDDRVSLYRILIRLVADVLQAEGRLPQVGGDTSAIAFTEAGLQVDMRNPGSRQFPLRHAY